VIIEIGCCAGEGENNRSYNLLTIICKTMPILLLSDFKLSVINYKQMNKPADFISKLYDILNEEGYRSIIAWHDD
jgi:hypothetical protein